MYTQDWIQFVDPFRREATATLPPRLYQAIAQTYVAGESVPEALIPTRSSLVKSIQNRPALRETFGDVLTSTWTAVRQNRDLLDEAHAISERLRAELRER